MPVETGTIAGLILAGGRSRRMGGGDKYLMELGGATMLDRAIDRLSPQVTALAISSNSPAGLFRYPVLADPPPAPRGPLSGLQAGLAWAHQQGCSHLATAASDTPFFPSDLVERLAAGLVSPMTIALAASGGRAHPVFGLWPVAIAPLLDGFMDGEGSSRMMDFVERCEWRQVEFGISDGIDPFFNVNTRDDFEQAVRLAGRT